MVTGCRQTKNKSYTLEARPKQDQLFKIADVYYFSPRGVPNATIQSLVYNQDLALAFSNEHIREEAEQSDIKSPHKRRTKS